MPKIHHYQLKCVDRSGPQPHDWTVSDRVGPKDAIDLFTKRLQQENRLTQGLVCCDAQEADYQLLQLGTERHWWIRPD